MGADLIPLSKVSRLRMRELGIDEARVLRLAGISPEVYRAPRPRFSTRQFFALWQAIGEVSDDPALGLRMGEHRSAEHVEVILLVAMYSANFHEAMEKIARYKRLVCPEEITVEYRGAEAIVHYRWTAAENHAPPTLTDAMFASGLHLVRRGTGNARSRRAAWSSSGASRRPNAWRCTKRTSVAPCASAPRAICSFGTLRRCTSRS